MTQTPRPECSSRIAMDEPTLRAVLLVRAVEEQAPALGQAHQDAACLAALGARSDSEMLGRRAVFLQGQLPSALRVWRFAPQLPGGGLSALLLIAFGVGMSSSYLGNAGQFHVMYNPVVALLCWNLFSYFLMGGGHLIDGVRRMMGARRAPVAGDDEDASRSDQAAVDAEKNAASHTPGDAAPWWLRRLLPGVWQRYLRLRHGLHQGREDTRRWALVGQRYMDLYFDRAGRVLLARSRWHLHALAMALSLGAIAGLYLHGLFAEYHAVWRSTFIDDDATIGVLLNALLAPALLLQQGQWLDVVALEQLRAPGGAPAAVWLHRLALMTAMIILLPRAALALMHWRRCRQLAADLWLDPADTYVQEILLKTRQQHEHRIRHGMAAEIDEEVAQLALRLSAFVRESLFDRDVRPLLLEFRRQGGRLQDLEQAISLKTQGFEAPLNQEWQSMQQAFSQALQARLYALIGRNFPQVEMPALGPGGQISVDRLRAGADGTDRSAVNLGGELGNVVAADLGSKIGLVVATAVSAATGSISGGLGKSIGIAVISHLLGTSGPIGLLIGAVIGLAGGGAAYVLGKDKLRERVKLWRTPAPLARMALSERKLDAMAEAMASAVEQALREQLAPMRTQIIDALLAELPAAPGTEPADMAN